MKLYIACSLLALSAAAVVPAFARPMTETDLATMKRLASPTVSPDGKTIAYVVQETDLKANKRRSDLYLLNNFDVAPASMKIASKPEFNETDPVYSPDGKFIYFLSNEGGSNQPWRVGVNGENPERVIYLSTDVSGFKLSPNGMKIAIWADIARDCPTLSCERVSPSETKTSKGSGREFDELFVRHWDEWETPGQYSRIFVHEMAVDGTVEGWRDVKPLDGDEYLGDPAKVVTGDSPSKPMGGGEEIAWAADSKSVFFALRKAGRNEPLSTNLDIYQGGFDQRGPNNLTEENKATDTLPAASPDGKWLAWAAMARAGYEADRQVLMLRDLKTDKVTALTAKWDRSVDSIAWAPDSKALFVTAQDVLDHPVFKVDLKGIVTRLTDTGTANDVIPLKDGSLLYTMNSVTAANDLYLRDTKGNVRKLTHVNAGIEAQIDDVTARRFSFAGANGEEVWGQITRPTNATGKLPVAFIVHGGPQGSFGNGWSFRWNPRVMASQGYAVVSIDFHGSTGYGQKFTDSINKNWGGWPLEDLQKGLAAAGQFDPLVDTANACALGGSYGGYMMNWISGNWPDGFKCLVNHAGIFDLRAMAYETEELWFDQWDHGGPWTTRTDGEKWNPVHHVAKWKTPTLVIHGEKDYRIPYSQSLAAFTALQQQGVESKLLVFPDENHWVLKPQNSIQWHRTVFDWLGKHLKK